MTFRDVYKFPLQRKYSKVFTSDFNMAFDFMFELMPFKDKVVLSFDQRQDIIDILNDVKQGSIEGELTYDEAEGSIKIDGKVLMLIRGWGHMKSLEINPDEAARIQKDFANYIINKLSKHEIS